MPSPLYKTLCLPVTLHSAWKVVRLKNSAGGIDGHSVEQFERKLAENLGELRKELVEKSWNPEPYLRVEIEKNETEKRKLRLLSVRDKIVQQAIKMLIEPRMEKMFLNNSYGYRPGKGPSKAVGRASHLFNQLKSGYVAKLDIDDYFDTIQHERLFSRLRKWLADDEIIQLIELSVKTGVVTPQLKWNETTKGIPQGAVLSPLLANFYLHPFDQFVVSKLPGYVRYADDFIVATASKEETENMVQILKDELDKQFFLKLNTPLITDLDTGVEFLGITIKRSGLSLSEKKKEDLFERINSLDFYQAGLSQKSKETLQGIKNYYARLLPPALLKELDSRLIARIHEIIKKRKTSIPNKTILTNELKKIDFLSDEINLTKNVLIKDFVDVYQKLKHPDKKKETKADNKKLINQKKKEYQKRENEGSELVINTPGSFIGKSNKGITIKVKGQIINKKPTTALKHITVTGQGSSISSHAIQYCINNKIPIDFFDAQGKHYASILSTSTLDNLLWKKQALLSTENKIALGSRIILGKLKNQENLIKYYHKYHKDLMGMPAEKYPEVILRIDECVQRVKSYAIINDEYATYLMGQEASAANAYWEYIRLLIADDGVDFQLRERQGASDLMNSMLNYGYAILYARIWNIVLIQKLNPMISVIHAPQPGKPTFVYDLIELFRAQAVDRVVVSLIQRGEPLKMNKNLLSEPTKRLLIQNILERLNRYEKYRGEEIQFTEIMRRQVHEVAAFISGESKTFKPYIAKW